MRRRNTKLHVTGLRHRQADHLYGEAMTNFFNFLPIQISRWKRNRLYSIAWSLEVFFGTLERICRHYSHVTPAPSVSLWDAFAEQKDEFKRAWRILL